MEFNILHLSEVDSTQDEAFRQAQAGAPEGTVVWADRQRVGRGRRGRAWQSPEGGLYFSILLRRSPFDNVSLLPLSAGLAVADLLESKGVHASLKWPNDVIVDHRKLAGVLCEKKGEVFIVGVGINVHLAPLNGTISFSELIDKKQDTKSLLNQFMKCFSGRLKSLNIVDEVNLHLFGKNEPAIYEGQEVTLLNVAPTGALRVRSADGIREITAGEIVPMGLEKVAAP